MEKVWIVKYTYLEPYGDIVADCAVFSNEEDAKRWAEENRNCCWNPGVYISCHDVIS